MLLAPTAGAATCRAVLPTKTDTSDNYTFKVRLAKAGDASYTTRTLNGELAAMGASGGSPGWRTITIGSGARLATGSVRLVLTWDKSCKKSVLIRRANIA